MTTQTNPLQIFPSMCAQQCRDLDTMLSAVDEFGATALALSGSTSQGYMSFIQERDSIRKLLNDIAKNYRLVA